MECGDPTQHDNLSISMNLIMFIKPMCSQKPDHSYEFNVTNKKGINKTFLNEKHCV